MSYCIFDGRSDLDALKEFVTENPLLLLGFIVMQVGAGMMLNRATTAGLTFLQRMALTMIISGVVFIMKAWLQTGRSFIPDFSSGWGT